MEEDSASAEGLALDPVMSAAPPPLARLLAGSALSTHAEFSEKVVPTTLAMESRTKSPPPSTVTWVAAEAGRAYATLLVSAEPSMVMAVRSAVA